MPPEREPIRTRFMSLLVALVCLAAPSLGAQGTVLTFDDVTCRTNLASYSFGGFRLTTQNLQNPGPATFASWCTGDFGWSGSTALLTDNGNSSFTQLFTLDGPFAIRSIRLANVQPNTRGGPIEFEGTTWAGVRVRQSFTVNSTNPSAFGTFLFGEQFTDLRSLKWITGSIVPNCGQQGPCLFYASANVQFDDITVFSTAPEPGGVALLVAGMLGLVLAARWRSSRRKVVATVAAQHADGALPRA